jgi:ribosome-associated protein
VASSGPGGQNVNKNATKAELYWDIASNQSFYENQKKRIENYCKNKINKDGRLLISSDRFRTQAQNKQDCLDKLEKLLNEAMKIQKKRIPTKLSRSKKEKRSQEKKKHSEKKSMRSKKWD